MSLIDQAGCVGTSILFDLGFHQGEGLAWLTDHYSIDSSWIVFAFEPNSKCAPYLKQAHLRSHACFIPLPFAVDAKAGQAVFQREVCWRSGAETGEGSHLQDLALIGDFTAAGEELIWRINFPQFLRAIIPVKDKPFVVVKMDIEGAEYSILRALLADFYERQFGVTLNSQTEILPLMGSKEGIMHISLAFLNEGDEVLIPNPG